ncbi:putative ribonuclease H-like domain-containing protein [Tanacetum coccineum]
MNLRGFKPALSFMKPFGCHVTILNTLDSLDKFDGKSDEGFFVGYSLSSKAFRVYNTRTRKVEENFHVRFLENKPIIEGNVPKWLFDIDSLTQSMSYVPVTAGTSTNESASTQGDPNAGTFARKPRTSQDCIVMPIWKDASYFDSPSKEVDNVDEPKQVKDGPNNESDDKDKSKDDSSPKEVNIDRQHVNIVSPNVNTSISKLNIVDPSVNTASSYDQDSSKDMLGAAYTLEATHIEFLSDEDESKVDLGNIPNSYEVPTTPNTRIHKDHPIKNVIGDVKSSVQIRRMTQNTNEQGFLSSVYKGKTHEDLHTCLFACFLSQEEPKRISKALSHRAIGHTQEEGINYDEVFAPVARIEAIRLFLAYASFMGFMVYQMDVKSAFLYGQIEEEVYVCQPPRFEDPNYPDKVYKIYVDDIIFGSTKKELCTEFEKLMKDKFQMSFMGELTFFLGLQIHQREDGIFINQDKYVDEILRKLNYTDVKSASTLVDLEKSLFKDGDGTSVDEHLYRSMIGSLMYLTASRPDIMDSPFKLVAYTNSDYAGATQDRKFTTRGCQFLGNRLISWQCKKQTMVATSTTEAKYMAAASCCGQVGDEAVHKELGDRMERAATTATSLEAEQDFITRRVLLRCDSMGELYPITKPSTIPHAFLTSQYTWRHPGSEVLRRLVSSDSISCNKEKLPVLCHACQLGKHVKLPFVSSSSSVTSRFLTLFTRHFVDHSHSESFCFPILCFCF